MWFLSYVAKLEAVWCMDLRRVFGSRLSCALQVPHFANLATEFAG